MASSASNSAKFLHLSGAVTFLISAELAWNFPEVGFWGMGLGGTRREKLPDRFRVLAQRRRLIFHSTLYAVTSD